MPQDTNKNNLIINKLTKAQFNGIASPSTTELYFVTDDTGLVAGTGISINQSSATISLVDNYGDTKNPYGSKTQKYVLAAPNAANGVPSFRALVASDIPALNYQTNTSSYAGGTAVTLNNTSKASSTASFYAPISGGTAKTILVGAGTTAAPVWSSSTTWSGSVGFLKVNANGVVSVDTNTYLTSHQSLSNYVTLNTEQVLSGIKHLASSSGVSVEGNPMFYFRAGEASSKQKMGGIFINAQTVNNKKVAEKMYLRQYSYNSSTGESIEKWDQYYFPAVTADLTSTNAYLILTTKNAVTIGQGGTGATTAADARTNLGLGTFAIKSSLAWNEITQSGANSIAEGTSNVTDNTEIFTSYASDNGFADTNDGGPGKVYRRDAIKFYNYIQGKTDNRYLQLTGGTLTGNLILNGLTASQAVSTNTNKQLISTDLSVNDPTASGNGISYIATISQNSVGKITATKSTVRSASTSQTGVVQLNSATNSTSTSQAATPSAVKQAYDLANTANTTANNHKYWASLEAQSAVAYNTAPEVATIKINGNTSATGASTNNVTLVYNTTTKALDFNFV